ncbi:MAG: prolipoprotein diacylglyceryl transferase [Deltaproteobacteria bacterium]|nr:prolipoprotein diacylglyceryl transferase [Deltaproteobacteria bacterium]
MRPADARRKDPCFGRLAPTKANMIPYFSQPTLSFGIPGFQNPFTIHAFGALVATAIILGTEILRRRAKRLGLDPLLAGRLVTWALVGGFIGAHLVDRFIYKPGETLADPLSIIKIWAGLSSFGGFLGATVGVWMFIRRGFIRKGDPKGNAPGRSWEYLDLLCFAFPFGWIFGRMGCFVAFDHPGLPTDFFLAMADADGIVRHNLGLDEAIYTVLVSAVFFALRKPRRFPGFFVGWLAVAYAPVRFMFDFLREVDVRYFGFTPGQFGAVGLVIVGVLILKRGRRLTASTAIDTVATSEN